MCAQVNKERGQNLTSLALYGPHDMHQVNWNKVTFKKICYNSLNSFQLFAGSHLEIYHKNHFWSCISRQLDYVPYQFYWKQRTKNWLWKWFFTLGTSIKRRTIYGIILVFDTLQDFLPQDHHHIKFLEWAGDNHIFFFPVGKWFTKGKVYKQNLKNSSFNITYIPRMYLCSLSCSIQPHSFLCMKINEIQMVFCTLFIPGCASQWKK